MLSNQFVRAVARSSQTHGRRAIFAYPRSYAQVASVESKPPIPLYGVDGTYASALYTAAAKTSNLENTSKALNSLSEVLKKDERLPTILSAPALTAEDKSQIVQELQKHIGGVDKSDTMRNFLQTLADNNRLGLLGGVCEKFTELMSAAKGELEMVVTSAAKLEPRVLQRLETAVSKSEYSQGKKLKPVAKVNPDIIGGLVVEVGDRTIDLSVSSRVAKMNKLLTDAL